MIVIDNIVKILKTNIKSISLIIILVVIVLVGVFSFIQYKSEKDFSIGQKLNEIENVLIQIEREKEAEENEISLVDEEKIEQVKVELTSIYEKNKGFKNGLRAQFILAKINYKNLEKENAKKKFLAIFETDKKHYLSPISLLYAAFICEEEALFSEAQKLLEDHKLYYEGHYTGGEGLITLARIYEAQGQYDKSLSILEAIQKNSDLNVYHKKAKEQIDLLIIKGLVENPSIPNIPPNFGP